MGFDWILKAPILFFSIIFHEVSHGFVALWYGGTIAFCTLAGALLGPRLLRW